MTTPTSLYVNVAERSWPERRPGVSDDTGTCTSGPYARHPPGCIHTVISRDDALVLAVMSAGTGPC